MGWIDKKKLDLVMSIFRQGGDKSKLLTGGDNTGFFSRKGIAMRDALRRGSIIEESEDPISLKRLIIQRDDVAGNRLKEKKFMGVETVKEDVKDLKEIVDYKKDLIKRRSPSRLKSLERTQADEVLEQAIESQTREQKFTKQSTKDFIENFGGSAEFRKWKKAFERSLQGFDN